MSVMGRSTAPQQVEAGEADEDDRAEDEPKARHERHRRDDGTAFATAMTTGRIVRVSWAEGPAVEARVGAHDCCSYKLTQGFGGP